MTTNLRSECSKRYRQKKIAAGWKPVYVLLSPEAWMNVRRESALYNVSIPKAIERLLDR